MNDLNILTLGVSGFPYLKTAPIIKCNYINKILIDAGYKVLIVSNEAIPVKEKYLPRSGTFENIPFYFTTKEVGKSKIKLSKYLRRTISKINEFFFLIKFNCTKNIHAVIFITNGSFLQLLKYRFLSILLNFRFILVYHEYRSDFSYRRKNIYTRLNDKLFDRYCLKFVDAFLPISEFLIQKALLYYPKKAALKIPSLADFERLVVKNNAIEPYFLFCGSVGFVEIISFIIKSFELIESNYSLYLVCSGDPTQIRMLKEKIEKSSKKQCIKLFSDISSSHLNELYDNAKALLIPLKDDIRDQARFPQKVAEYVSSGNPIISTNYGEIAHYFLDKKNALIAEKYQVEMFAEKMKFVIDNPEKSVEIGEEGRKVGLQHFNYKSYSFKLRDLINGI